MGSDGNLVEQFFQRLISGIRNQHRPMWTVIDEKGSSGHGTGSRIHGSLDVVQAAGATYVARYSVWHTRLLIRAIRRALAHPGFAFVEVLSPCPTQAGRRNQLGTPAAMLSALKERCVPLARARQMSPAELAGKTIIGEFVGGT